MKVSKGTTFFVSLLFLLILSVVVLTYFPLAGSMETGVSPMNASITQTIALTLSGNLSTGIFFTNTSTLGIQYAITSMNTFNNASKNYNDTTPIAGGTAYYVEAPASNTANMRVCHCACNNLTCSSGSCTPNTDKMYVNTSTNEGVWWANGTTPTGPANVTLGAGTYPFNWTLQYQVVNASMPFGTLNRVYLRYWLDPYPNTTTSGVYNTTYKFIGIESSLSCGTCSCP